MTWKVFIYISRILRFLMVTDTGQDTSRGLRTPAPSRALTPEASFNVCRGACFMLTPALGSSGLAVYIISLDVGKGWSPGAALGILGLN